MKTFWLSYLIFIYSTKFIEASLINDFLNGAKNLWPKAKELSSMNHIKDLPQIRFEIPKESQRFLEQGLDIIKAPKDSLDLCSHRVILTLEKNCNQMGSEDIGKLAVMLMNCQLETEGRSMYPCKPEMTLAQCTFGFDKEIEHLYNIVSQRALSVCAALKQQQLRMFTEIAVNRLMQMTQKQTSAINEALQNQKRINEMGVQNIQEYRDNFEKIQDAQIQNMEYLGSAKDQIMELNTDLHRQLEIHQLSELKLINIEKSADIISEKLENTNEKIMEHYNEAIKFMEHFKNIMQMIAVVTSSIEGIFDKINEIMSELGLKINQDTAISLILNLIYFVCGMIFILFLNLQRKYKRLLIILFAFNSAASLIESDISILSINIFVWISFFCYNFMKILKEKLYSWDLSLFKLIKNRKVSEKCKPTRRSISRARSKTPLSSKSPKSTDKNNNDLKNIPEDDEDSEIADLCAQEMLKIHNEEKNIPLQTPQQKVNVRPETPSRPMTPAIIRVMQIDGVDVANRAGTPFHGGLSGRIQCQAYTKAGAQCRNAALIGYSKCKVHNYD